MSGAATTPPARGQVTEEFPMNRKKQQAMTFALNVHVREEVLLHGGKLRGGEWCGCLQGRVVSGIGALVLV